MITVKTYFNWILINAGFCLLPLFFAWLIVKDLNDSIISSFISYSFTLIISSLYIFDRLQKPESSLKWLSILFAIVLMGIFIFYPGLASVSQLSWINKNLGNLLVLILVVTLVLSFWLNLHTMNNEIKKNQQNVKYKAAKETGQKVDGMINELKKEKE